MITTYLLENCVYCKQLLKYIQENPTKNISLVIIPRGELSSIKKSSNEEFSSL